MDHLIFPGIYKKDTTILLSIAPIGIDNCEIIMQVQGTCVRSRGSCKFVISRISIAALINIAHFG